MMNNILGDLIRIRLVIVYLDDILIFGTCLKEHRRLVKEVLKRLQFNDLYAKAEKCFFVSQTSFGHISIKSLTIPTVSTAPESPWKDLLINTIHVLKQSIVAEILGRLTGNHYNTIY